MVLDRYGIAGHLPRWRAASRFDLVFVAFVTECGARLRSGPMSRSVSKLRLSLASPPVIWKAIGKPPKSVFQVNFGRETATRAAKRLIMLPLLRPLPRHGRAPRWNRTSAPNAPSRSSPPGYRRTLRKFQIGSAAKLLPHAVPVPEFLRKSPPSDIMNDKIVQGFGEIFGRCGPCRRAATAMSRTPAIQSSNPLPSWP